MEIASREMTVALEAAEEASRIIMQHYGADFAVSQKPDATPVTAADLQAERRISEIIRRHFPQHGILGEESGEFHIEREWVWVVDPIDGTKNYIRGIPLFGTQIALLKQGAPYLGVSRLPAMGELLCGERGHGAYVNGQPARVSQTQDLCSSLVSLGGLNHFAAMGHMAGIVRLARAAGRVRGFGDAYAYHLLATGRCEAVVEVGIRVWDIAAFAVIVEEAGGTCTDLEGGKVGLETRSVICSNGAIHRPLIDLFQHRE